MGDLKLMAEMFEIRANGVAAASGGKKMVFKIEAGARNGMVVELVPEEDIAHYKAHYVCKRKQSI